MTIIMTREELAHMDALNTYGSDPEDSAEHEMLRHMRWASHPEKIPTILSSNWPATLAAVQARGPRCDRCGNWTFRPLYLNAPKALRRLCPDCAPGALSFLEWSVER